MVLADVWLVTVLVFLVIFVLAAYVGFEWIDRT